MTKLQKVVEQVLDEFDAGDQCEPFMSRQEYLRVRLLAGAVAREALSRYDRRRSWEREVMLLRSELAATDTDEGGRHHQQWVVDAGLVLADLDPAHVSISDGANGSAPLVGASA